VEAATHERLVPATPGRLFVIRSSCPTHYHPEASSRSEASVLAAGIHPHLVRPFSSGTSNPDAANEVHFSQTCERLSDSICRCTSLPPVKEPRAPREPSRAEMFHQWSKGTARQLVGGVQHIREGLRPEVGRLERSCLMRCCNDSGKSEGFTSLWY